MKIVAKNERLQIGRLALAPFGTNAYLLTCRQTGESLVVDAPGEADRIVEALRGATPKYLLLTHGHMDHIGALDELRARFQVSLAAHPADAAALSPPPEIRLSDGDTVSCGHIAVQVLHTPGHTPGSLSFRADNYLLSGDTLFPGGPGKTPTPAAFRQIVRSITEKLFVLDDTTRVFPGHGETTVLKREKEDFSEFSSRRHPPDLCGDVLWRSA